MDINIEQIEAELGPDHSPNKYVQRFRHHCPIFKELSESQEHEKYHYAYEVGQGRERLTREKLLKDAPQTHATCFTCEKPICGVKKVMK